MSISDVVVSAAAESSDEAEVNLKINGIRLVRVCRGLSPEELASHAY